MGILDNFKKQAGDLMAKAKNQTDQGAGGDTDQQAGDTTGQAADTTGQAGDTTGQQAGGTTGQGSGTAGQQAGDTTGQGGGMDGGIGQRADDMAGQAGDAINKATGGRMSDQVDEGVQIAQQRAGDADQAARAEADRRQG